MDHEQIRQLLTRAQEIETQKSTGNNEEAEIEQIITAAEESGLSREAVMRALRERTDPADRTLEPESLVVAKGGGRHFHAAKVLRVESGMATIQFLSGPEVTVRQSELRPLTILPGKKVTCSWPVFGWRTSTVLSYDKENQTVSVTDTLGWNKQFPLADIRINQQSPFLKSQTAYWILTAAMTLGGGVIGATLMHLFSR